MPEYLAPGVFVEEIDGGSKPIEGVGTNTAAFIGYAKSGEFNKPVFISNWSQFCQFFGEEENALLSALSTELKMSAVELLHGKKSSRKNWMDYARGLVMNAIDQKKATVKNWPEFLKTYNIPQNSLPYMEGSYLAHSVRGYYDNGGGRAYVVRVARPEDLAVLAQAPAANGAAALPAPTAAEADAAPVTFRALTAGASGNNVKVTVEHVGDKDSPDFRVKITGDNVEENFPEEAGKGFPAEPLVDLVNKHSRLVRAEVAPQPKGAATKTLPRPAARVFTLTGGKEATSAQIERAVASGPLGRPDTNGLSKVRPDDFIGDEAQRTGIGGFASLDNINMVIAPDLMAGVWQRETLPGGGLGAEVLVMDEARQQAVIDIQCAMVGYCERMGDRMAILDPIPGLSPDDMRNTTLAMPHGCDRGQAAIYYPWIKIADPVNRGQQMFVPPSGHIAGVWARVGVERGVHKAPANESLIGAVALEWDVSKGEQEILNPEGINCIRAFPGTGIRVWGARTLATVGNPSWKYVNVRRLFNYLEKSMERGMQWVVFEPNDADLWARVRRNLSAFLFTEWREGKLFGSVPSEAFYVKCDDETNPQEMVDLGRLYVEVGINPVKPAEFVIVRMGQWSGGGSTSEA